MQVLVAKSCSPDTERNCNVADSLRISSKTAACVTAIGREGSVEAPWAMNKCPSVEGAQPGAHSAFLEEAWDLPTVFLCALGSRD